MMNRICPICLHREKILLYKQSFGNKTISLMEGYNVVACGHCGFVYADKIPSQADFNRYYATMSKYEFDYNSGIVAEEYVAHFKKIVDFLTPHIKDKNAKILDIGCSTGCLLSLFKQIGYFNLLGVDPSPVCIKTAKELYGIKAVAANIFNFTNDDNFDLIVLSAVLEHIVDLNGAMAKIRLLLKDGGLLFIDVPDAARFDSYIYTPFQQFSIEHINYFSRFSIRNLLSKHPFELIEIKRSESRINQTVDPDLFILARKSDKKNFHLVKDDISEFHLRKYITKCLEMDSRVKKIIQKKIANKEKIIVWGVGTHTQRLIGLGLLDFTKILYFVDSNSNYRGKKIKGIEIKSPQDIKDDVPILISTYSYQDEIAHQIKEVLKLNNEIIKIY